VAVRRAGSPTGIESAYRKRGYRRTALSRVWQCELHPGDGLEVRHFGRTRFLPNWQPAPIKAPAFFSLGLAVRGWEGGIRTLGPPLR
jgi:hypothetical protein